MSPARSWLLGGAFLSFSLHAYAFYLPGAAPHDYHDGEEVRVLVNTLTPILGSSDNAKIVSVVMRSMCSLLTRASHRNRS